jgi:DNA modification methylase
MSGAVLEPGDCRDVLLEMAARGELFDAVICDPPYDLTTAKRFAGAGIADDTSTSARVRAGADPYARGARGFMSMQWDGTGVAFDPETWRAVYDVLKPGAHLLAFGGTRTFHRMAVAIEDAGFEIRDTLCWLYGTGFPKSHDVSKGIDKAAGAVREVVGPGQYSGRGRRTDNAVYGEATPSDREVVTAPATPEAAQWQGWGTALKPAFEPIIVARKPLGEKTVAANVLAHGTGALNIDASRIPLAADDKLQDGITGRDGEPLNDGSGWGFKAVDRAAGLGRWPANVVHDGSDDVLDRFAEYGSRGAAAPASGTTRRNANTSVARGRYAGLPPDRAPAFHNDSGSAARFYYSAKATKHDRAGSSHPTVKPLALMRWLCRLVTPPGGCILDPFAGSGTTLQAAVECGFSAVGIEREAPYQSDIRRRLAALESMFA